MTRGRGLFVGFVLSAVIGAAGVVGVGCTVTAYQPTQQPQTTGGGGGSGGGGSSSGGGGSAPTQTPTPTQTPSPPIDIALPPVAADMAAPAMPASCKALNDCCAQLQDPADQQQCMDGVGKLDDGVCAFILQQLQDGGYCI